jgi:ferritin
MLNQAVQAAMNDQIRHEFNSAHFYLSASGYFESINLSGFAQWMRLQSQEEVVHALKLFDFMHDRGSRALLQAIDEPPHDFSSALDAFMRALQNEQKVTGLIHDLYALAVREQDYPTQILLQWFVTEQVEEEKSVSKVVEELKMAGDNASALLLLNHELGARRPRRRARPSGHAG